MLCLFRIKVALYLVCSAMTHLALEVRGDALKFLNELMQYEHGIIRSDFLDDCLEHFADMCGTLGHSQTLKLSSQATMLKVQFTAIVSLEKCVEKVKVKGALGFLGSIRVAGKGEHVVYMLCGAHAWY